MEIFAHHAHVFPKRIREDGSPEALLCLMKECGIHRAVAFAPFYEYFEENFQVNEWLAQEIKNHSELIGFGVIDFRKENLEEQVKRITELGLKGIKIHPAFQKIKIDGEKAFRVYRQAEKNGLILSFHTGVHWHRIAEYQTLQSEINPHFLHNILNLLIALNRLGDRTGLEQSIISLSRMFRYTCEHNFNSTLQQEFDFIKDYLYLQKTRFDERLEFQIFIEPGLEAFEIPKLLVQPLIENAIVHGLEPSDRNEFIQLSALTTKSRNGEEFTVITVINSGLPYIEKMCIRDRS